MNTLAFFNNKGGVGKTSLVYHLARMFRELGLDVLTVDLDPQANLSTMFLDEDRFDTFWPGATSTKTILSPLRPFLEGEGGIGEPHVEDVDGVGLLVGDLGLSAFEDELSQQWPRCLSGDKRAFRVIGAFHTVIMKAAKMRSSQIVLIDVGPNLGSINRAALIAADHVIIPLAPDLFSLKGLENLGPCVRKWREEWKERLEKRPADLADAPRGSMNPLGYVVMQHAIRHDRPVKAYDRFMQLIPTTYRDSILDKKKGKAFTNVSEDPSCLATLKHYRSLMPLAQEARKPMFDLRAVDGAIGAHVEAVRRCYEDFEALARTIAKKASLPLP